jgi:hypothetical protein
MILRSMDASVDAWRNTPAPVRDAGQHEIYPRVSASNFSGANHHSTGNSRGNKCPARCVQIVHERQQEPAK